MSQPELKLNDILALDRNKLAAERTLMAWIRTALSMISFGFTIYKFLQVIDEQSAIPFSVRTRRATLGSYLPASERLS